MDKVTPTQKAKELAEEHWNWVGQFVTQTLTMCENPVRTDKLYCLCGFLYRTAFVHGHKHGQIDAQQTK